MSHSNPDPAADPDAAPSATDPAAAPIGLAPRAIISQPTCYISDPMLFPEYIRGRYMYNLKSSPRLNCLAFVLSTSADMTNCIVIINIHGEILARTDIHKNNWRIRIEKIDHYDLVWSPDGNRIACSFELHENNYAHYTTGFTIWDTSKLTYESRDDILPELQRFSGSNDSFYHSSLLAFSPDTGTNRLQACICTLYINHQYRQFKSTLTIHDVKSIESQTSSPAGGSDATIGSVAPQTSSPSKGSDATIGEVVREYETAISSLKWIPTTHFEKKDLLIVAHGQKIEILSPLDGFEILYTLIHVQRVPRRKCGIIDTTVSFDNKYLASFSATSICVWDLSEGLDDDTPSHEISRIGEVGQDEEPESIKSLSWSPKSREICYIIHNRPFIYFYDIDMDKSSEYDTKKNNMHEVAWGSNGDRIYVDTISPNTLSYVTVPGSELLTLLMMINRMTIMNVEKKDQYKVFTTVGSNIAEFLSGPIEGKGGSKKYRRKTKRRNVKRSRRTRRFKRYASRRRRSKRQLVL
jgi:hypothetical protein